MLSSLDPPPPVATTAAPPEEDGGAAASVSEMQASLESMGLLAAYDHVLSELVNRRTSVPPSHLMEFVAREFERFGQRWQGGMVSQTRVARDAHRRKRQMHAHMQLGAQTAKLRAAMTDVASRQALRAETSIESEREIEEPPERHHAHRMTRAASRFT